MPSEEADTRGALVTAGRRLFAERGYEGATVRAITGAAGANVASVAYHFGSKEGLYLQVIMEVLSPLGERIQEVAAAEASGTGRIEALLQAVFEHLWDNPDQAQIMVEVRLHRADLLPQLAEMLAPMTTGLMQIVTEAQASGVVREGPPLLFVMSLMAQPVYFMLLTRRAPEGVLPANPHTAEGRKVYVDHMVEFALGGLAGTHRTEGR